MPEVVVARIDGFSVRNDAVLAQTVDLDPFRVLANSHVEIVVLGEMLTVFGFRVLFPELFGVLAQRRRLMKALVLPGNLLVLVDIDFELLIPPVVLVYTLFASSQTLVGMWKLVVCT